MSQWTCHEWTSPPMTSRLMKRHKLSIDLMLIGDVYVINKMLLMMFADLHNHQKIICSINYGMNIIYISIIPDPISTIDHLLD